MKLTFVNNNVKKITTTLIFVLSALNLSAQTPDELMNQGNKFYQDGNYELAVESYHKILSQGFESPALYYNLGNAYFKLDKPGYSILNYERGLKLSPGDEDLSYNLKITYARTADKITELPKLFIVQWWDLLVTTFSVTGWSVIAIIVYCLFLASIGFYLLSRNFNLQRISFMTGSVSLAVMIITFVIMIARYEHQASADYGVLLAPIYSVKVSPDEKSSDTFVIHEGIKFTIEDHVNGWAKIRLVDGKVGWVFKNSFGQI